MASIFSRIIAGEIPGRFVWRDDVCVVMVDIRPLAHGHVMVIPIEEVDHWVDLSLAVVQHLTGVAHTVAAAQMAVFSPPRIGLMIAGFEVPHTHLHVVPMGSMAELDFRNADTHARPEALDEVADLLRAELRRTGHGSTVPD